MLLVHQLIDLLHAYNNIHIDDSHRYQPRQQAPTCIWTLWKTSCAFRKLSLADDHCAVRVILLRREDRQSFALVLEYKHHDAFYFTRPERLCIETSSSQHKSGTVLRGLAWSVNQYANDFACFQEGVCRKTCYARHSIKPDRAVMSSVRVYGVCM
jgi:hypothetical protein